MIEKYIRDITLEVPYQVYKSALSRLQKCPIDEVTNVPYVGYKSANSSIYLS